MIDIYIHIVQGRQYIHVITIEHKLYFLYKVTN